VPVVRLWIAWEPAATPSCWGAAIHRIGTGGSTAGLREAVFTGGIGDQPTTAGGPFQTALDER
jgi:hypothetical protein